MKNSHVITAIISVNIVAVILTKTVQMALTKEITVTRNITFNQPSWSTHDWPSTEVYPAIELKLASHAISNVEINVNSVKLLMDITLEGSNLDYTLES